MKRKFRFLAVSSIILLCIAFTIKELQNDTFYMIKLGEYITQHGIDLLDHYCWIMQLGYTYPHWLFDILVYFVYSSFGYLGVYISSMIFFVILILLIYYIHLRMYHNEFLSFFVSVMSIVCLYGFITARAQVITIILFLLEVYFLEKLLLYGRRRYILYLTIISLLVANLHATIWLFTFVLYLPFLVEYFISVFLEKRFFSIKLRKFMIEKTSYIKSILFSFILSFLMGLFTPSRICYSYVFRIMMGDSQKFIMEHAPMVVIEHFSFLSFIFVFALILTFSSIKVKFREFFMICGLMFMCLVSIRHLIFFYTIGLLYISILCNRYLVVNNDITLDTIHNIIVNNNIVYVCSFFILILVSFFQFQKNFQLSFVPKEDYPVDAVHYIQNNLNVSDMRLYNAYDYGSYLLFNNVPVFIDSRCDLYLKEFNGLDYSIFDDAMNIEYNYEERFDFYQITHALIQKDSLMYKILNKDQDYNVIYQDNFFALFEKV